MNPQYFDCLRPSQQFFSYVRTGIPGWNQYYARVNVSCSRTQSCDPGDAVFILLHNKVNCWHFNIHEHEISLASR